MVVKTDSNFFVLTLILIGIFIVPNSASYPVTFAETHPLQMLSSETQKCSWIKNRPVIVTFNKIDNTPSPPDYEVVFYGFRDAINIASPSIIRFTLPNNAMPVLTANLPCPQSDNPCINYFFVGLNTGNYIELTFSFDSNLVNPQLAFESSSHEFFKFTNLTNEGPLTNMFILVIFSDTYMAVIHKNKGELRFHHIWGVSGIGIGPWNVVTDEDIKGYYALQNTAGISGIALLAESVGDAMIIAIVEFEIGSPATIERLMCYYTNMDYNQLIVNAIPELLIPTTCSSTLLVGEKLRMKKVPGETQMIIGDFEDETILIWDYIANKVHSKKIDLTLNTNGTQTPITFETFDIVAVQETADLIAFVAGSNFRFIRLSTGIDYAWFKPPDPTSQFRRICYNSKTGLDIFAVIDSKAGNTSNINLYQRRIDCDPSCGSFCSGLTPGHCLTCSPGNLFVSDNTCITAATCPNPSSTEEISLLNNELVCCVGGTAGCCLSDQYTPPGGITCLPCDGSCKTCDGGSSSTCLSCHTGLDLLSGKCQYPPCLNSNEFRNSISGLCEICHITCKTCENGNSDTDCTDCEIGRTLKNSRCEIESGGGEEPGGGEGVSCANNQFKIGSGPCQNCHLSCLTCFDGSADDQCSGCKLGEQLSSGTCLKTYDYSHFQKFGENNFMSEIQLDLRIDNSDETILYDIFSAEVEKIKLFSIYESGIELQSITRRTSQGKLVTIIKLRPETKSDQLTLQIEPFDEKINKSPLRFLVLKTQTLKITNIWVSETQKEIEKTAEEQSKTFNSLSEFSQTTAQVIASVATFTPFDPTGIIIKLQQSLDLLEKFKYINVYKGRLLEIHSKTVDALNKKDKAQPNFEEVRLLLEEGDDNLEIQQNGNKGRLNWYGVTLGVQGTVIYKIAGFMISWWLKMIGSGLIWLMKRRKKINTCIIHFLKIQRQIHFLVFGLMVSDILFYTTRILLHRKTDSSSFLFKLLSVILTVLVILDFSEFFAVILRIELRSQKKGGKPKKDLYEDGKKGRKKKSGSGTFNDINHQKETRSLLVQSNNVSPIRFLQNSRLTKKKKRVPILNFNSKKLQKKNSIFGKRVNRSRHLTHKLQRNAQPYKQDILNSNSPKADNSIKIIKNSSPIHKSNKPTHSLPKIIDFEKTIDLASHNYEIEDFLLKELRPLILVLQEGLCLSTNLLFILRISIYQILIVSLPHLPRVQVTLLLFIEFGYLIITIVIFCKFHHLRSILRLISKLFQSLFILGFFMILGYLAFKNGDKIVPVNLSIQKAGIFFRSGSIVASIILAIVRVIEAIVEYCKNRKLKVKNDQRYIMYQQPIETKKQNLKESYLELGNKRINPKSGSKNKYNMFDRTRKTKKKNKKLLKPKKQVPTKEEWDINI